MGKITETRFRLGISLFITAVAICGVYLGSGRYFSLVRQDFNQVSFNHLSALQEILLTNVSFLSARRAEKNLIIFREDRYENEWRRHFADANKHAELAKFSALNKQDKDILDPLEVSLRKYQRMSLLLFDANKATPRNIDEIEKISLEIRSENDTFTENVSYALEYHRTQIQKKMESVNVFVDNLPKFVAGAAAAVALLVYFSVPFLLSTVISGNPYEM